MSFLETLEKCHKNLEESVYNHQLAVKWNDGSLEGFSASALSSSQRAEDLAKKKAQRKAKMTGNKEYKILSAKEFASLDGTEKKRLERDWKLSQRMDESVEIMTDEQWMKQEPRPMKKAPNVLEYPAIVKGKRLWVTIPENDSKVMDESVEITEKEDEEEIEDSSSEEMEDALDGDKRKEIAQAMSTAIAVGLAQIENIIGEDFSDAAEAEKFFWAIARFLKSSGHGDLKASLRRFDRIGGERVLSTFKRELAHV